MGISGALSLLALAAATPALAVDLTFTSGTTSYNPVTMAGKGLIVRGASTVLSIGAGQSVTSMVDLHDGGTVSNAGTISRTGVGNRGVVGGNGHVVNEAGGQILATDATGVLFYEGGSVTNKGAGSLIRGGLRGVGIQGAVGSITNTDGATIELTSETGVFLGEGGSIDNGAGAKIIGQLSGVISIGGLTLVNDGSITGTVQDGAYLAGGTATNTATGSITGANFGLRSTEPLDLTNYGIITGTAEGGVDLRGGDVINSGSTALISAGTTGIFLDGEGSVVNANGARIVAGDDGVIMNYGGDVTNSGGASIVAGTTGIVVWEYGTVSNSGAGSLISGNLGLDFTPFELTGPFELINEDGAEIEGNYAGARFLADGKVSNSGGAKITGIINGVLFEDGGVGTVINTGGATIVSGYAGVNFSGTGSVTNSGEASTIRANSYGVFFEYDTGATTNEAGARIVSVDGSGVVYYAGGSVTNRSGAGISGKVSGVYARGGDTTVSNDGTGSTIHGDSEGVFIAGGAGTVTNTGGASISGADTGVWLYDGGSVSNGAGASISGRFAGIFTYSDAIIDNAGTVNGNVWLESGAYNQVTLHTGSRIDGELAAENNSSSKLTLTGAGTQLYSGAVTGDTKFRGTLIKSGAGTWVLDKDLYAQYTSVGAGTLIIGAGGSGSLDSDVDVTTGGTVGGSGTIYGNLIVDGRVRPGNSIGTLTVAGYQQNAGAIYTVELDPASTASDRIDATGVAKLIDGAGLEIVRTGSAPYRAGTRYTVLSSAVGLSGTFQLTGDVTPSAFLTLSDVYDRHNAYLLVDQTRQLSAAATSANQQAVANGLQSAGPGNSAFDAVVNLSDDAAAAAAFTQLDGNIHAAMPTAILGNGALLRQAAIDRLRAALCNPEPAVPTDRSCRELAAVPAFWSTAYGGWSSADRLDNRTGGFLFGVDGAVDTTWRVGAYAGIGQTEAESAAQRASSSGYSLGAYAGGAVDDLVFRFGASAGRHDISTTRSVGFSGLAERLTGDYGATAFDAFGEVGYRARFERATVEPFARLDWAGIASDSFAEQGGDAALGGDAGLALATGTLGIHTSMAFMLGDLPAEVSGTLGWSHTLGDPAAVAELAFAGSDSFRIATAAARDSALLALDLALTLGPAASFSLGYDGTLGIDATRQTLRGRLAVQF